MTNPDIHLAGLFAADLPPARDHAFQAEVLAALARRRLYADLGRLSAGCALAGGLLAVVAPAVSPVLMALAQAFAPAGITMGAGAIILWMNLEPSPDWSA